LLHRLSFRYLYLVLALTLLVALQPLVARWQRETAARSVAMVVDYYAFEQLATIYGLDRAELWPELRGAGVWGAALGELTLNKAAARGYLQLLQGGEVQPVLRAGGCAACRVNEAAVYVLWWEGGPTPPWLVDSLRRHVAAGVKEIFPLPADADAAAGAAAAAGAGAATAAAADVGEEGLVIREVSPVPVGLALSATPLAPAADLPSASPLASPPAALPEAPLTTALLAGLGLGLAPEDVAAIRAAGLVVVPRFAHHPTITAAQVAFRLKQLDELDLTGPLIFAGVQLPGYPATTALWTEGLAGRPNPVGLIEFARQPGTAAVVEGHDLLAVRVHSITPAEMATIDIDTAIARFRRAVRERNIRLLYIHPIPPEHPLVAARAAAIAAEAGTDTRPETRVESEGETGPDQPPVIISPAAYAAALVEINTAYIARLAAEIKAAGFRLGPPSTFQPYSVPQVVLLLLTIGVGLAGAALAKLLRAPRWIYIPVVLLAVAAAGLAPLLGYDIFIKQTVALAAAIIFPSLAVLSVVPGEARKAGTGEKKVGGSGETDTGGKAGRSLSGHWLFLYCRAALFSLVGGLIVAAVLADTRFLLQLSQFLGVKLAHIAPPLIVLVAFFLHRCSFSAAVDRRRLFPGIKDMRGRVKEWLLQPIPLFYALGLSAVVVGGFVYILRTGNQALPVGGWEQALRQWLEEVLLVRPRTKEILFGHPLLVAALASRPAVRAMGERASAAGWLLAGAAVGQLSMVNSFSHIHTPLLISLWRTLLGLAIGLLVGYLVVRPIITWLWSLSSGGDGKVGDGKQHV